MIDCTLCYLERDGQYLMLLRNKKQRDVNAGKWIGVGGRREAGETPEACALREIREETGLTVRDLTARGVVNFVSDAAEDERMFLYTARDFEGTLIDCDEGELHWIDREAVFGLPLWDGDRIFLQKLLDDAPYFEMTLTYEGERLRRCVCDGQALELLDVYRPDGSPAGYVAERGYMHRHGIWHITAHTWIVRRSAAGEPELLLQLRSVKKRLYPGFYDISSAGHIDAGEDVHTAALRELEEELGLHADPSALRFVGIRQSLYDDDVGEGYHDREYCYVYLYEGDVRADELRLQESEVDGFCWMAFDALVQALREGSMPLCVEPPELELLAPALT